MVDWKLKELREPRRRRFLQMMGAAAAGFAVERSRLLNYLADTGGHALADAASCAQTNRSVHIVSGGGNFCLWQLLWPHPVIGTDVSGKFAFLDPGQGVLYSGGERPFFYGKQSPFMDPVTNLPTRPMTAYLAGTPKAHEDIPFHSVMIDGVAVGSGNSGTGISLLAAIAAVQRTTVSLLPVIGVKPVGIGSAPGAPAIATVNSADDMLGLFSSKASKTILALQEDKSMFETYYKAFMGLRSSAVRASWVHQLETTKKAANLLGKNLATFLTPSKDDLINYGVNDLTNAAMASSFFGGQAGQARLANMAKSLLITKKAMALGLTNSVVISLPSESSDNGFKDPHGAFVNKDQTRTTIQYLGKMLDAFYNDCATSPDPACTSKTLDKTIILTVHGDHPHNPFNPSGWPDSTPGNSNWVYVMGNGYLPGGWHGQAKLDGGAEGIDPATGAPTTYNGDTNGAQAANAASAAILYAVAQGDMKVVRDFYKRPEEITALVKPKP